MSSHPQEDILGSLSSRIFTRPILQRRRKQEGPGPGQAEPGVATLFRRTHLDEPRPQASFRGGRVSVGGGKRLSGAAPALAVMTPPKRSAPGAQLPILGPGSPPDSSQDGSGGGGASGSLPLLRDAMTKLKIKGPTGGVRSLAAREVTLQTAGGASLGELAQATGPDAYDEGGVRGECEVRITSRLAACR